MKNTVKKILALVFVVAMVCTLAVPAFAAEFTAFNVDVAVVNAKGEVVATYVVPVAKADKANVLETLRAADVAKDEFRFTIKNNVLVSVADADAKKIETDNAFDTQSWVVALNGKAVEGDLAATAVAKDDKIVVYLSDSTLGTKLVMFDDSALAQGIVTFFYYDAEGNKQPLVDAVVTINGLSDYLNEVVVTSTGGIATGTAPADYFVTDEKGQIWIAPDYLDDKEADAFEITSVAVEAPDEIAEEDGYTKAEVKYFNEYRFYTLVTVDVDYDLGFADAIVLEANLYDVAGATGDMTVVYALVAAAAVVTLGAVVIMKKKAVKAN